MRFEIRIILMVLVSVGMAALGGGRADAQTYPVKPIRLIDPFSPGGSLDLVARTLARSMSAELGQQVVVERGRKSPLLIPG